MYGEKNGVALGSIFRLTENALITRIEQLVTQYPNVFRLTENAGMHQLFRYEKPRIRDNLPFNNIK
jgi:hypothetical protein